MSCKLCNENLQGKSIPELALSYYNGQTHFSKVIEIYDLDKQKTVGYECPVCHGRWNEE